MVVLVDGPGFDAAVAEGSGEVGGEAVEGEGALGGDEFDEAEEVGEIGVVGKREGGVALIAEGDTRIEGPAGDHRGAAGADFFEERRLRGLGRADDDVAGEFGGGKFAVGREGEAELFVNLGELVGLRVEHHREFSGGEAAEEFLAFAEAVSKKYGRLVFGERGAAEGDDVGEDFFGGRKDVLRAAEGGLHDEDVGVRRGAGFGGEAAAEFEIASVKECAVIGVREEALG